MNDRLTYVQWLALALSLLAWAGTIYFASTLSQGESDRAASVANAQQSSTEQDSAVRTHALVQDSAAQRTQLGALLDTDVVSIANMIEAAGKAAGVTVTLGDAVPETAPPSTPGGPSVQAVGFVIDGQGTFAELMRAAQLFETLPIPSSVERLDIQKVPSAAGASSANSWHMNISIRVLTTSNISS